MTRFFYFVLLFFPQGSISTDSVEISINNSNTVKKEITTHDQVDRMLYHVIALAYVT